MNYDEALSEFIFNVTGKIGDGLPSDYFTKKELEILENIFKNHWNIISGNFQFEDDINLSKFIRNWQKSHKINLD